MSGSHKTRPNLRGVWRVSSEENSSQLSLTWLHQDEVTDCRPMRPSNYGNVDGILR